VRITGAKATDKMYHRYTGYIGNLKTISFEKLQAKAPGKVIELAVRGMLPKNPLGRAMYRKLRVYPGPEHRHAAQQPRVLDL
jgi:large subunit ribosomal protein L13